MDINNILNSCSVLQLNDVVTQIKQQSGKIKIYYKDKKYSIEGSQLNKIILINSICDRCIKQLKSQSSINGNLSSDVFDLLKKIQKLDLDKNKNSSSLAEFMKRTFRNFMESDSSLNKAAMLSNDLVNFRKNLALIRKFINEEEDNRKKSEEEELNYENFKNFCAKQQSSYYNFEQKEAIINEIKLSHIQCTIEDNDMISDMKDALTIAEIGDCIVHFEDTNTLKLTLKNKDHIVESFDLVITKEGKFQLSGEEASYNSIEELLEFQSIITDKGQPRLNLLSCREVKGLIQQNKFNSSLEAQNLEKLQQLDATKDKVNFLSRTLSHINAFFKYSKPDRRKEKSIVHLSVEYLAQGIWSANRGSSVAMQSLLEIIGNKKGKNFEKLKGLLNKAIEYDKIIYNDIYGNSNDYIPFAENLAKNIKNEIQQLPLKGDLMVPVFYKGHAMMAVISRDEDNGGEKHFTFRLYNEGGGLESHNRQYMNGIYKSQSSYRVSGLTFERLCESQFMNDLIVESKHPDSSSKHLYEHVLKKYLGDSEKEDFDDPRFFTSGQLGGSCSAQGVLAAIKGILSHEESTELKRDLRLHALNQFYADVLSGNASTEKKVICLELARKLQHSYKKQSLEVPAIINDIEYRVKRLVSDVSSSKATDIGKLLVPNTSLEQLDKGKSVIDTFIDITSGDNIKDIMHDFKQFKKTLNQRNYLEARSLLEKLYSKESLYLRGIDPKSTELKSLITEILKLGEQYTDSLIHNTMEETDLLVGLKKLFDKTLANYKKSIVSDKERETFESSVKKGYNRVFSNYERMHVKKYFPDNLWG
ncbi:MAG: hypothetical protein K0S74_1153 [Chlamydiales bacterium]|jgi:hypothetical protein|nr:hypothetical protein [Chlamydiales bacterium]